MPASKKQILLDTAQEFMDTMQCYQERQEEDKFFDPKMAVYDLYCDLLDLYEYVNEKLQEQ